MNAINIDIPYCYDLFAGFGVKNLGDFCYSVLYWFQCKKSYRKEDEFMEYETQSIRRHFSKLGLMYFLGGLIILGVQLAVSFLAVRLIPSRYFNMDFSLLISSLPMYLIGMPLMSLLIKTVPAAGIEKHKMTFRQWLAAFAMCYAIMYLGNLIGVASTFVIGLLKGSQVQNALLEVVTGVSPWTALFLMVLCAPVAEELIFRKFLIERTVQYGEKTAILFSGLFFGLFHGNLNQFAYAFLLGIFFGFIYARTGKLIYTIMMHMVINFFGSVAGMFLLNYSAYDELMNSTGNPAAFREIVLEHLPGILLLGLYGLVIMGIVIAGIICLAVNAKKMKLRPAGIPVSKGALRSAALLNVGVILFILFWIIQIILQLLE